MISSPHYYLGPERLRTLPLAAILNSRQSKYPIGTDEWIGATAQAVAHAQSHGYAIFTSLGMNTWEITLTLASASGADVLVVVPEQKNNAEPSMAGIMRRFRLSPDKAGFHFIPGTIGNRPKSWWPLRDAEIARIADVIFPISIRPHGSVEQLVETCQSKVDRQFAVPYQKKSRPRPRYGNRNFNPEIWSENLIVHFTRTRPAPWPDETEFDFYQGIINSGGEYCHSAKAVIIRILRTGKIFAGSRKIRDSLAVVGFSEIRPESLRRMFAYRPQMVNPYFEPYGIGMRIETAIRLGMRPVIYGAPEEYETLTPANRPYFQNRGAGGIWQGENEWRHLDDLELDNIDPTGLCILVPDVSELHGLKEVTKLRQLAVFCEK